MDESGRRDLQVVLSDRSACSTQKHVKLCHLLSFQYAEGNGVTTLAYSPHKLSPREAAGIRIGHKDTDLKFGELDRRKLRSRDGLEYGSRVDVHSPAFERHQHGGIEDYAQRRSSSG